MDTREPTARPTAVGNERKLAAIMFTDIVGFSRQMDADEARMLRLLDVHNQIISQAVTAHHGHVIKTIGDAFLVDFPSVVHAVQCAQAIHTQFRTHNAEQEPTEQIHVRIGIHLGDVVQKDGDVFGDGVNIASRLQALAEPDTICISQKVYEKVAKKLNLGAVVSLGKPKLKNIAERFAVYALLPEAPAGVRQKFQVQRLKVSRRISPMQRAVVVGLLLIVATLVVARYFPFPLLSPQSSVLRTEAAPAALPLPDKPSIVVLPFVNMSNDPEQEYFSDGITEDITADLSKISSLFVIARNSAFTYRGKAVKVQDVSREMGVHYVLEGSVRRSEDQMRVTAQLIDASTGYHLWSERYDRPLKDIFALQDEIRQRIVFALKVQLTEGEQKRFRQYPTNNLEAYDYFLRGREVGTRAWNQYRKEANVQARQLLEKAIELDPQYAAAYAWLGWTYHLGFFFRWDKDPAQSQERSLELAQRAVALDNSLSVTHWSLSNAYLFKRQHQQAITEIERAIALNPSNTVLHLALGFALVFAGNPEEAIGWMERGMRLDPRNPVFYLQNLGWAYRSAGRYEEAIAPLKRVLSLTPAFIPSRVNLAVCYVELGREEEARAEAAEVLRLNPGFSVEDVWRKENQPFKDPTAVLERLYAAARKAGLK